VTIKLDGNTVGTPTLVNGVATYTFAPTTSGAHIIMATYSGDATYAASNSTLVITATAIGGFTISAAPLTIVNGNTGTTTITITPSGGYTGSVGFTISTASPIANTCYALGAANVTSSAAVQTSVTIYTNASTCTGYTALKQNGVKVAALKGTQPALPGKSAPVGISLAGLMLIGVLGRKSRRLRGLVVVALLTVAGFGLSGCGDSSGSTSPLNPPSQNAPTGAYTVTLVGMDAVTPSVTSTTTFTLTIQ
jgi:hypothetical protein